MGRKSPAAAPASASAGTVVVVAETMTTRVAPMAVLERPSWRGLLHTWAFVAAIPAGALLVVSSERAAARTAAAIYAATLLLVFG